MSTVCWLVSRTSTGRFLNQLPHQMRETRQRQWDGFTFPAISNIHFDLNFSPYSFFKESLKILIIFSKLSSLLPHSLNCAELQKLPKEKRLVVWFPQLSKKCPGSWQTWCQVLAPLNPSLLVWPKPISPAPRWSWREMGRETESQLTNCTLGKGYRWLHSFSEWMQAL